MARALGLLVGLLGLGLVAALADPPEKDLTPEERAKLEREATELNEQVEALYGKGKFAEAADKAGRALAMRERLYPADRYPGGHPDLATSLDNLGALLGDRGEYAKAQPLCERALAMYERLYPPDRYPGGHPDLATSLTHLGGLLRIRGEYARAQVFAEQALAIRERLYPPDRFPQGHLDLARSLNNLGSLLDSRGEYARAQPLYERAVAMYERLYPPEKYPQGHPELAYTLNSLGFLLHFHGENAKAQPCFERALAMRERLYPPEKYPQGHPDLATSLDNLGALLIPLGEYARAQTLLERALAMRERLYPPEKYPQGHPELAHSRNNLGFLLLSRGEYARAQPFLEGALAIFERLYPPETLPQGHPNLADSIENLGILLLARGEYARARPYLERALAMHERLYPPDRYPQGHPHLARGLNNLAVLLLHSRGERAGARPYLERALAMYERLYPPDRYPQGHPNLAQALNNLAFLLDSLGEPARAQPLLERALAMYERLYPQYRFPQGHPDLAASLGNLGGLLDSRGEPSRAQPLLERSLAMYQRQAGRLLDTTSEAEALAFTASLPLTQSALLSVSRQTLASAGLTYGLLWSGKAAVTRLLERRRLAVLAARGDEATRSRCGELLDARRRLARLLLDPPADPAERDRRNRELTDEKERLERELAALLPPLAARDAIDRLGSDDLRQKLPPRTALVDLHAYTLYEHDPQKPGKDGEHRTPSYVAFVLRPDRPVERVELGDARPIHAALDQWRQAIADRLDSPAAEVLRRLVWDKVAEKLPEDVETVYISPDGELGRLPWAALPGRKPGTVLLEDHAVAVVPHGPALLAQLLTPPKPAGPADRLLAVGGVAYDTAPDRLAAVGDLLTLRGPDRAGTLAAWSPLGAAPKELAKVRAAAGARPVTELTGAAASTDRVMRELPTARIAHVATHGFFAEAAFKEEKDREKEQLRNWEYSRDRVTLPVGRGARNPLAFAGLALAGANKPASAGDDGGILTGEVIAGLPLDNLDLAVLSACSTALGDVPANECVRGLQHAFHVAGCRTVVASLWNVPDEPTAALMAVFYDELLRNNKPPLEALRAAQLYVYRHPDEIKSLADRGAPIGPTAKLTGPAPAPAGSSARRAATKDWAGFVLSGLGR